MGAKSRKGLHFRRVYTIIIPASPPMAGWLFLAWLANNLLVPPSAALRMLSCSCFTITVDTMGESTTLAVRYHLMTLSPSALG